MIIGHWRSGTTHLHNLLLQDQKFGSIPLIACLLPDGYRYFGGLFRLIGRNRIPTSRPMDNVPTGVDEPMSEDFAMAGTSDLSHYTGYYFPRRLEETFCRSVLFEGCSQNEIDRWGRNYIYALKKAAMMNGGRRLVLKNPPNTGRLPAILDLYPDAKFIHVARNPFVVHKSSLKLQESFIKRFGLQSYDREQLRDALLKRQRMICKKYLADRRLVPPKNLVEVRHEDVVADPIDTVRRIYQQFEIDGFEESVLPRLEAYVESIRDYQQNEYQFDEAEVRLIREELQSLLDEWSYDLPSAATVHSA